MPRELSRAERASIRKLVITLCAIYDSQYGCLSLDCPCVMLGKIWTGAYCKHFRAALLPLDPTLEAALTAVGPPPDFKTCPICGGVVASDGRQTYCSAACAKAAHRKQQRAHMREKRGGLLTIGPLKTEV